VLTEAIMMAHGFSTAMLVGMACDGFVTVVVDTVRAGDRTIKVRRLGSRTQAGRQSKTDQSADRWLVRRTEYESLRRAGPQHDRRGRAATQGNRRGWFAADIDSPGYKRYAARSRR